MLLFDTTSEITSEVTSEATSGASPETVFGFWDNLVKFFIFDDGSGTNTGYLVRIGVALATIVIAWIIIKIITAIIKRAMGIRKKGPDIDVSAKWFIANLIKFFLWLAVAFLVISILNIDVTGIAGVASAITVALGLALQDIISCFASGVIILNQKHILTGDYIQVKSGLGETEGSVKKITFLMTYLDTPAGQEVTIPNNNMQKAIITNFTRTGKRRLDYDVGVNYKTDIEVAKKALRSIVDGDKRVIDNNIDIYLYNLGEYSIGIRIRVWTKVEDYWSLYNELSEKVLIALRKVNVDIPSSTDITIKK